MVEFAVSHSRRSTSKLGISIIALGVTMAGAGFWDTLATQPAIRDSIAQNTPECNNINQSWLEIRIRGEGLWNSRYTLEELSQRPEFRDPLNCYKAARENIELADLGPSGGRTSRGLIAPLLGIVMTAFGFGAKRRES